MINSTIIYTVPESIDLLFVLHGGGMASVSCQIRAEGAVTDVGLMMTRDQAKVMAEEILMDLAKAKKESDDSHK